MTEEKFELGIKIVVVVTIILLICEGLVAVGVIKTREVSTSVLEDIPKDVSNSELLKDDVNEIEMQNYYIEE